MGNWGWGGGEPSINKKGGAGHLLDFLHLPRGNLAIANYPPCRAKRKPISSGSNCMRESSTGGGMRIG